MRIKKLALLTAILITMSAVSGCGSPKTGQDSNAPNSSKNTSETSVDESGKAKGEITQLTFVNTVYPVPDDELQLFYKSPVYAKLKEKTGVELIIRGADTDQAAIYFASGDLGDIANINSQSQILPAVESETILPLNELVEKYGPNISKNRPDRWKMARNQLSVDGSGNAYVLPIRAGSEGHSPYPGHNIFYIRWDLYGEMGFPEVKNEGDFLNVLSDMYKAHPTTAEGIPTYPVGFSVTTTDLRGFYGRWAHTYGYRYLNASTFLFDVDNGGKLINAFKDPIETFTSTDEPMFFAAAKYYNKAYKMGLLDKDSFTQQAADYVGKCSNGQYLSGWWRREADAYVNNVMKTDPTSKIGFEVIPIDGMTLWTDTVQTAGWESYFLAIPASAKDPAKSIQFLDYLFSQEGCRLILSGVEGEHWNVVNGEPVWTDEVVKLQMTGGKDWLATGIACGAAANMIGLGDNEKYEKDGGPLWLLRGDDYMTKGLKPVDIEYCEKYNVNYPLEHFLNMKKEGKANTHESLDMRIISSMGSTPDNIAILESSIVKTAAEAIPALVMSKTDEEFAAQKKTLMTSLDSIGLQTVIDWYQARYEEVVKDFAS